MKSTRLFMKSLMMIFLALAFTGCGGSGGGSDTGTTTTTSNPLPVTVPLTVDHVTPLESATGVTQATTVSITFSRTIDSTTVTATTFTLVGPSNTPVSGTINCSGAQATFTPASAMASGTTYTATVSSVKDSNGNTAETKSWTFTTSTASNMPVAFLGAITNRWVNAVGSDTNGNVIIAYLRSLGASQYYVAAQRYNKAAGSWGGHTNLATVDVNSANTIKLAVSKNGNAVVVWSGSASDHIYYSYYKASINTWSSMAYVSHDTSVGTIVSSDAAIDDNGNVMTSWSAYNNGNYSLYARYISNTGMPKTIQNRSASGWPNNQNPRFAFDASGNGMLVWGKWRPVTFTGVTTYEMKIASVSYNSGTDSWSDEVEIADGTNPDIAIDATGKAVAVWVKQFYWNDPAFPPAHYYYGVGSATRAAGAAWDTTFIGAGWDPKGNASNPKLAITPTGDAMVVWTFWRGTGYYENINAAYLPAGASVWLEAGENVGPVTGDNYAGSRVIWGDHLSANASTPRFALDSSGNATLVYVMNDGTRDNVYTRKLTYAARGTGANGWSEIREIDTTNSNANSPIVTIDGTGIVTTVWHQPNPVFPTINDFWFLRE